MSRTLNWQIDHISDEEMEAERRRIQRMKEIVGQDADLYERFSVIRSEWALSLGLNPDASPGQIEEVALKMLDAGHEDMAQMIDYLQTMTRFELSKVRASQLVRETEARYQEALLRREKLKLKLATFNPSDATLIESSLRMWDRPL